MKKIRLSTVSQVYEAFLHSRKALGAKEVTLRTYRTSFLAVCKYADISELPMEELSHLDCYSLHPGVTDDETLGRIYVEDMELLDVPDNVLPYFDFEAYGRDMRINEGGHFAPTGYLTRSGDFKEVYLGIEDIPAEHRIFAYPKLNIREQMAAYKEVIDRSSLEGERLHPRKEHDDR